MFRICIVTKFLCTFISHCAEINNTKVTLITQHKIKKKKSMKKFKMGILVFNNMHNCVSYDFDATLIHAVPLCQPSIQSMVVGIIV